MKKLILSLLSLVAVSAVAVAQNTTTKYLNVILKDKTTAPVKFRLNDIDELTITDEEDFSFGSTFTPTAYVKEYIISVKDVARWWAKKSYGLEGPTTHSVDDYVSNTVTTIDYDANNKVTHAKVVYGVEIREYYYDYGTQGKVKVTLNAKYGGSSDIYVTEYEVILGSNGYAQAVYKKEDGRFTPYLNFEYKEPYLLTKLADAEQSNWYATTTLPHNGDNNIEAIHNSNAEEGDYDKLTFVYEPGAAVANNDVSIDLMNFISMDDDYDYLFIAGLLGRTSMQYPSKMTGIVVKDMPHVYEPLYFDEPNKSVDYKLYYAENDGGDVNVTYTTGNGRLEKITYEIPFDVTLESFTLTSASTPSENFSNVYNTTKTNESREKVAEDKNIVTVTLRYK